MKEVKISWFLKLLMHLAPKTFLRYMARRQGVDSRKIDYAIKLFSDVERVDMQPLSSRSG